MSGVWYTTGGGGGIILAIAAAAAAIEGAEWVLARIWWIVGTGLLCAVLAAVAAARVGAWQDRRSAEAYAAIRLPPPAQLHEEPTAELPRTERPAVTENHWHVHHHYADGREPARVTAIPGTAGDAITREE